MGKSQPSGGLLVQPKPLNNFQSSDGILFDTLHGKAIPTGYPCKAAVCQGALMQPKLEVCPFGASGTVNMEEMEDFYRQYHANIEASEAVMKARIQEVKSSIKKTGAYDMKHDELEFACKTAWRNASRCIGRIQWSKLKLYDGRGLRSTREMFKMICSHLEYGTNGGNIRSAITVFPSKQSGISCRIWNTQYICYAGFEVSPGVIVGDPTQVDLTKICLQLGWKPKVSRFQVLPIVLQYGDNNPEFFELPESLVLEVPITHPKYPKLEELNLKWFAMPAVSFMSMDCGGQLHPATSFNGWYMSTEVVRDMCDQSRYNLLPEIAESMGLDTSKPAVFWKDIAAIEFNVAVVSSFQAMNVTITDHHTAAETFIHHMESEQTLRGGCPADWVWINPPLGASLTPVFHQEMINYKLKPSYEYQQKPWVGFNWKGAMKKGNVRKEKLTLRSVARAMVVCYKLMNAARKQRKHCTIVYATETGKSERFALKLQRLLDAEFNVEVFCMDKYKVNRLFHESLLFVVTSTFGNGEAPDNGKDFENFLMDLAKKKNPSWSIVPSEEDIQQSMNRFAVFGLGSSAYPDFCSFSKRIDNLLEKIGVKRLLELGTGDEQKNQEQAFKNWSLKAYQKTCQHFHVKSKPLQSSGISVDNETCNYKLQPSSERLSPQEALRRIHKKDVAVCSAESVASLVSEGSSDNTILVSLKHQGLTYSPGDHLAVFPINSPGLVQKICRSSFFENGTTADTPVTVKKEPGSNLVVGGLLSKVPAVSLREALTLYLDIESRPKPSDLENLLQVCQCSEGDKKRLLHMSMNSNEYNQWVEMCPNWADLVTEFPSLRIPATFFFTELPYLQPRYYSISNSPLLDAQHVHLTVSVLKYCVGSGSTKKEKFGLCSNWLQNIAAGGMVNAFVRRCPSFHLPDPATQDVIMIGAGSGLAPFRSFWQHKLALKKKNAGQMYLFQGTKSRLSLLHRKELNDVVSKGTIEARYTAFSREKHIAKTYVQDKILEHASLIYDLLIKRKAHIYVCGDIKMAVGVTDAIKKILKDSKRSGPSTVDPFSQLSQAGRYHEDIYSVLV